MTVDSRSIKVNSGRPAELEAGYAPHLEGLFATKEEADCYVKTWMDLYVDSDTIFWTEA